MLISDLKQENVRTTETNVRLSTNALCQLSDIDIPAHQPKCRSDYGHLPHEILLQIFEETQPASQYTFDTSVAIGPRNPWLENLRTKKALALVCRAWCGPATELLYADIVIRRMGQVSALARTFREHRPAGGLSRLVREITLDACIVLPLFAQVVREDLEFVLQTCTRLRSFSARAAEKICSDDAAKCVQAIFGGKTLEPSMRELLAKPSMRERVVNSLRVRELHLVTPETCFERIVPLLSSAGYLTTLILESFPDWPGSDLQWDTLPPLCFPALEDLQLVICQFEPRSRDLLDYIRLRWRLPTLRALTLGEDAFARCHNHGPGDDHFYKGILEAHGAQLTYLHLYGWRYAFGRGVASVLTELVHLCPVIEHLVMPESPHFYGDPIDIHSPTLRYLDFLGCSNMLLENSRVPQLTSTRSVTGATFIPRACHPSLIPTGKPDTQIVHYFQYRQVIQTRSDVYVEWEALQKNLHHEDGEEDEKEDGEGDEQEAADVGEPDVDEDSDDGREDADADEDHGEYEAVKHKPMPKDEGSLYEPSSGSEDEDTSDDDSWSASGDEQALPQDYEEDAELQNDRDVARRYLLERFSLSQRCTFLEGDADEEDETEQEPEGAERQTVVSVDGPGQDGGSSSVM